MSDEDLLGLSGSNDNYLTRNYIMEYLNDSVEQLLELKNIDPKIDVLEYFTEYFKTVLDGNHILYRDYSFVSSTPYNRACFIQRFFDLFSQLLMREEPVSSLEMHSLAMLICVNFPKSIIDKSFRITSKEENPRVMFKVFIYLFQLQFYYKEFISDAKEIYENIKKSIKADDHRKRFNFKGFFDSLNLLIEQANYSYPSIGIMKEVLNEFDDELDFYSFLHKMAFNDKLIKNIGKLPTSDKLTEYEDNILKTEKFSKEAKEDPSSSEDKKIETIKMNVLRQKSFTSISNSLNKGNKIKTSSSSESSSDTDT